jgi:hypothetical protein
MIRFILSIILILAWLPCYAQMMPFPGPVNSVSAIVGCNLGDIIATHNDAYDVLSDGATCSQFTASCSGTLGYGHVIHHGTSNEEAKICVYQEIDADVEPDANDNVKVGCSNAISSGSSEGTKTTDAVIGGAITSGNVYWVCVLGGAASFNVYYTNDGAYTMWFIGAGFSYASPPANMGSGWSSSTTSNISAYVEVLP